MVPSKSVLFQWTVLLLILKRGESCDDASWIQSSGNCYKIFTEKANKSVAESTCLELRSGLASISNVEEFTFLVAQLSQQTNTNEDNYWVGLHKIDSELLWNNRAPAGSLPWVDASSSAQESRDCFVFNGAKVLPFDCSAEANFVCEQWKLSDRQPTSCPPDSHKDMISDKCFWYSHMPLSKAGSEVACTLKHGRLVSMRGVFFPINIAMIITVSPPPEPIVLWTSLVVKNGSFLYEDGTIFDQEGFTFRRGDGDCVALVVNVASLYELHQKPCLEEARGFCELTVDFLSSDVFQHQIFGTRNNDVNTSTLKLSCPHGSNWQEHAETGFCYWETSYETTRLSWEDARKYCQSYGGDLASFHSAAEERIGLGYLAGTVEHSYWIGLYHDSDTDSYVWADGTPLDYENWDDGQPNHVDRRMRCGYMSSIRKKWSLSYCGRLGWFICKAPKQINPSKPVPPTPEPLTKCPESSSDYFFNGYCYNKVSLLFGWHRAQLYCANQRSNLLSLHDEKEVDFIIRLLAASDPLRGNRVWIGLSSLGLEGAFKWTDGSPVDFTNWDADEPNNFQNQEKCTSMYSQHGMWNDENCNAVMSFICKRRNGTIPDTTTTTTPAPVLGYCPKDFYMFGDRCFLPVGTRKSQRKNWTEAGLHCSRMRGYLASIRDAKDQAFMNYLIQSFKMETWIGLHDSIHSGVFYWMDNSPLFYTNWAQGEPSSYGFEEDCGIISYGKGDGGRWKDTQCHRELPYICQIDRNASITVPGDIQGTRCPNLPGYLKQGLSCYKVFTNLSTWEEAEAVCGQDHGHLVSIFNRETEAVVNYLTAASFGDNETFWIGLQYPETFPLKWVNGWRMTFSRWGRNEPKPFRGRDTCFFSTLSGFWQGAPCSDKKAFICHVNANDPPESLAPTKGNCPTAHLSAQWIGVGASSCFLFDIRYGVEWYTANFRCFREGAHLASFHSMETLEELQLYLLSSASFNTPPIFIGLTKNSEGGFQWADESPVDFVNWDQDEPRNAIHQCVEMRLDTMKWSVADCNTRRYYVCGKQKENMVFPTSLPLGSTDKTTAEKYDSSEGLHPGAVAALIIFIILLVVASAVVLHRTRPWKNDWNRYRVHSSGNITSFENATYSDEPNNIDIHDRNALFVKN